MQIERYAEAADSAGLVYVLPSEPGLRRQKYGHGFAYFDQDGRKVRDQKVLKRIRDLAIPPAYRDVWICADPMGHLQATGVDAKGRKQYRYHPLFREHEDGNKFGRMAEFGRLLPRLRGQIDKDLSSRGTNREKVLATIIYLLDRSLIRIGNSDYARKNQSFGLTTLRNRHVQVSGETILFNFVGKSGIRHRTQLHDRRLARMIRKLQDLPGQNLFQFVEDDGKLSVISSGQVNNYLRDAMGHDFSAKDFRTWWGSVYALLELSLEEVPLNESAARKAVAKVMKDVSRNLGNTPAVCRKSYVHPIVFEAFRSGDLKQVRISADDPDQALRQAERSMLRQLRRKTTKAA